MAGAHDVRNRSSGGLAGSAGTAIAGLAGEVLPRSGSARDFARSPSVPWATISPPFTPGPGPKSTSQSAARIVSSSCSTTITVLPTSRSRWRVAIRRSLSRGCRPIEGSSRM